LGLHQIAALEIFQRPLLMVIEHGPPPEGGVSTSLLRRAVSIDVS
jgi:hypothetical protein